MLRGHMCRRLVRSFRLRRCTSWCVSGAFRMHVPCTQPLGHKPATFHTRGFASGSKHRFINRSRRNRDTRRSNAHKNTTAATTSTADETITSGLRHRMQNWFGVSGDDASHAEDVERWMRGDEEETAGSRRRPGKRKARFVGRRRHLAARSLGGSEPTRTRDAAKSAEPEQKSALSPISKTWGGFRKWVAGRAKIFDRTASAERNTPAPTHKPGESTRFGESGAPDMFLKFAHWMDRNVLGVDWIQQAGRNFLWEHGATRRYLALKLVGERGKTALRWHLEAKYPGVWVRHPEEGKPVSLTRESRHKNRQCFVSSVPWHMDDEYVFRFGPDINVQPLLSPVWAPFSLTERVRGTQYIPPATEEEAMKEWQMVTRADSREDKRKVTQHRLKPRKTPTVGITLVARGDDHIDNSAEWIEAIRRVVNQREYGTAWWKGGRVAKGERVVPGVTLTLVMWVNERTPRLPRVLEFSEEVEALPFISADDTWVLVDKLGLRPCEQMDMDNEWFNYVYVTDADGYVRWKAIGPPKQLQPEDAVFRVNPGDSISTRKVTLEDVKDGKKKDDEEPDLVPEPHQHYDKDIEVSALIDVVNALKVETTPYLRGRVPT